MEFDSDIELQDLYDLVFGDRDPLENRLTYQCLSRRPAQEIKLFRQKVRLRFKSSDSLDGILAQNFRTSIGMLGPASGDDLLKSFIGSASFMDIRDVPGFSKERPMSDCFREFLAGIGADSESAFQTQLAMDFHQSLLVEAMLSPAAAWISGYGQLRFEPDGSCRIDFTKDGIRYAFVTKDGKIRKYKGQG